MFAVGLGAALLASAMFNIGLALQAFEARKTPKQHGLRLTLVALLLRRPLWILGLVLGVAGVAPQVYAFSLAPFAVVQTATCAGLVLLLYLGARHLHEHVGLLAYFGVALILAGVGLVSWGVPSRHDAHRGVFALLAVVGPTVAVALLPFVLARVERDLTLLVIVGSGAGFGASNIATKLLSDDAGGGHWPAAISWAVVALAMGVAATITQMTAFQRAPAALVVPTTTAIQTFVPVVLEPFFLRESWRSVPAYGAPLVFGLACATAGAILVTRTTAVGKMAAAAS